MSVSPEIDVRPTRSSVDGSKLRVLWLIKGLGPGGAERLLTMAAAIRDRDSFDYEAAYLLSWRSQLRRDLEREGMPVRCLDAGREWNLAWARRLRKLLRVGRFDIVHVHSPYVAAIARVVVRTLPRRSRPRMISTEHVPWSGYALPTRVMNRLTFPLDEAHLAVSGAVKESIPKRLARSVDVVVHGVRPAELRSALAERDQIRSELGIAPDEIVLGTVANYRHQKDYPTLLRAARAVLDAGMRVRFVAVGQGRLEDEIASLHRELDLGEAFMLLGYREDAARIMAAADVFVMSSLYEGLPVALMEAFCLGLPIVGTRVAGIADVVEDGVEGVLVPPGDPEALAGAIRRVVLDDALRAKLAASAGARAPEFDITSAVRRTEQLYRDVVRGGA